VQQLEQQSEKKDWQIEELKKKMNERELKSIKIENILKDELQLVKDKNNKLLKVEASLEIYKSRLAEIPDLKAKLTQALQTNLDYENISGDQMFIKEQNENL